MARLTLRFGVEVGAADPLTTLAALGRVRALLVDLADELPWRPEVVEAVADLDLVTGGLRMIARPLEAP